ncbi:DMT family transporter [Effusibacillus pohliae]|uniref:DMT family transporter n=1 Tax=Effusibacillus pohliae TaxID=232270 RepID=UPI00036C0C0C|nr:EamA family transporter [Effusibacillus pohliae]
MKHSILGAVCLALAASIWGGMYVVSKYVLQSVPPFTLLWLRYVIAVLVLSAILWKTGRYRIEKRDWLLMAWIGFVGYFVSVGAQFVGTKLSDAHTGALLTSASPAFILLFARWLLNEPITLRKCVSLVLSTAGVIAVIGWNGGNEGSLPGNICLVVAAVTWALLSVFAKRAMARYPALTVTTYALLFAVFFTTPAMLLESGKPGVAVLLDPLIGAGILYLGIVSTAGAFLLWNKGMELMDAGIGSLYFFFQPVVGTLLGWLLLDERLHWNFFIGGCLIIAGVMIATVQTTGRTSVSNLR